MAQATVLLTGATGFIGSHVAEELIRRESAVRCLIRPGRKGLSWVRDLQLDIVTADLNDRDALTNALSGIETVLHVAGVTKAKSKRDFIRGNVDTTRCVLEAAVRNGVQRFLFVSSLTVTGPSSDGVPLSEDASCLPLTSYGVSKLEAERVVQSYGDRLGVTILRPPAVYGPRDRDTFEIFRWVSYGIKPLIGAGERTLSMIHVRDLARAIVTAAFHERTTGQTYFVSDEHPYPFDTLIRLLTDIMKRRTITVPIPGPLLYALAAVVEGVSVVLSRPAILNIEKARDMLQRHWVCDPSRLAADTGFRPEVKIAEGLAETYRWYLREGWLRK